MSAHNKRIAIISTILILFYVFISAAFLEEAPLITSTLFIMFQIWMVNIRKEEPGDKK